MYPTENTVVVPEFGDKPRPITIEEVRKYGRIVALSDDNTRATVEVKIPGSPVVLYCGVLLNEDCTIREFIPRPVNKYVRVVRQDPHPSNDPQPPPNPNVEEYRK